MSEFTLDQQLKRDCKILTVTDNILVLLLNNSLLPWFILVPRVDVKELHLLTASERSNLEYLQDKLSVFIMDNFNVTGLNVAAIGNVVSQMHIHVIGRHEDDYAWPNVVWGRPETEPYTPDQIEEIRTGILQHFDTY